MIRHDGKAVGLVTRQAYVFPSASAGGDADGAWLHKLYLDAAKRWRLPGAASAEEAGKVFRSDTGELVLDSSRGLFTAVGPRVRIATGFMGEAGKIELGDVTIQCRTPFASISVVSLDGKPIPQSRRMLLTAVARSENTGQAVMKNHSSIPERGRPPVLCEPVDAEVALRTGQRLMAFPLTPKGQRRSALEVGEAKRVLIVATKHARSPWVLLTEQ